MLKWILLLPLGIVSVIEIWLLLTWGEKLGLIATMLWMVGSFCVGVFLLRLEGLLILTRIHRQLLDEVIPTRELLGMVLLGLGSLLLILPGFFTDLLGLVVVLPPTRWVFHWLASRALARAFLEKEAKGAKTEHSAEPNMSQEPAIEISPNE